MTQYGFLYVRKSWPAPSFTGMRRAEGGGRQAGRMERKSPGEEQPTSGSIPDAANRGGTIMPLVAKNRNVTEAIIVLTTILLCAVIICAALF